MRYAHDRPKGFRLALAFMGFILGVAHLSPIVVKDLRRKCISEGYGTMKYAVPTGSISSNPSGAFLVRLVLIFGMMRMSGESDRRHDAG
jgi:hypothetical protein